MFARSSCVALLLLLAACKSTEEPPPAVQIVSFTASKSQVGNGETVVLSWQVSNADRISILTSLGAVVLGTSQEQSGSATSPPLTASTTFILEAKDAAGTTVRSMVAVSVDDSILRVVSFVADPPQIALGASSTLRWTVAGNPVRTVRIVDGMDRPIYDGTMAMGTVMVTPVAAATYRLTAANAMSTATASAAVEVRQEAPVITSLDVSPNPSVRGMQAFISWRTQRADQIQVSIDARVILPWTAQSAAMGFVPTTFDLPSQVVKLEARNMAGTVSQDVTVTTSPVAAIDSFTVTPSAFTGTSTTVVIDWATHDADTVTLTADGAPLAGFPGTASGQLTLTVSQSVVYVLTVVNGVGMSSETRSVVHATPFTVSVVSGDPPLPADQVAVRVEGAAHFSEGTTGANGEAVLLVDAEDFPVAITAAKAGVGATSVMMVSAPPAEPLHLDPPVAPVNYPSFAISGAITGKSDPATTLIIDAYDLITVNTQDAIFQTDYLLQNADTPMALHVFEYDANGVLINATRSASVARGGPIQGLVAALPAMPPPISTALLHVEMPTSGIFPAGAPAFLGELTARLNPIDPFSFVLAGVASVAPEAAGMLYQVDYVATPEMQPELGIAVFDVGVGAVRVYHRGFGAEGTLSPGAIRTLDASADGATLGDYRLSYDGDGYDGVVVAVGTSDFFFAPWRVYYPGTAFTNQALPHLPSATPAATIGLPAGGTVSVNHAVVKMSAGTPWTASNDVRWDKNYQYYLVTAPNTYSAAGR